MISYNDIFEKSPRKFSGLPIIRDTRIPVILIVDAINAGYSAEKLSSMYGVNQHVINRVFDKLFKDHETCLYGKKL